MNGAGGRLIIESIPDANARAAITAFLSRTWKGRTEADIARLLSNLPVSISVNIPIEQGELLAKKIAGTGVRARFVPTATGPQSVGRDASASAPSISTIKRGPADTDASSSSLPQNGRPKAVSTKRARKSGKLKIVLLCTLLCILTAFWAYRLFENHSTTAVGERNTQKQLQIAHNLMKAAGAAGNNLPRDLQVETKGYAEINGIRYGLLLLDAKWIDALYSRKDFDAVESHLSSLLGSRFDSASMFELYMLYRSLGQVHSKDDIDRMKGVLDEWCSRHPKSHFPWLVRGYFGIGHAWLVRTEKLARDVPKEAWPVFSELLKNAEADLEKSYELDPGDPNSSCFLMVVARGLSYPREELEGYYNNALNACPWHYGARILKAEYLKPKWHGSKEELFEFAEECFYRSEDDPAMGFPLVDAYSELHYELGEQKNVLGSGEVWPIVQGVYENFLQKHPNDIRRRFFYSYYACRAGKFDIAYDQFEVVGDRWLDWTPWSNLEIYNRNRAYAHCVKGRDLVRTGNLAAAEPFLLSSIRYNETPEAYYLLSMCYLQGHDKKDVSNLRRSEMAIARALKLDPGNRHLNAQMKKTQDLLQANGASSGTK